MLNMHCDSQPELCADGRRLGEMIDGGGFMRIYGLWEKICMDQRENVSVGFDDERT
jgi:hypothetical protein